MCCASLLTMSDVTPQSSLTHKLLFTRTAHITACMEQVTAAVDDSEPQHRVELFPCMLASDQQSAFSAWYHYQKPLLLSGPKASGRTSVLVPMALNSVASKMRALYLAPSQASCVGFEKQLQQAGLGNFCIRLDQSNMIQTLGQRYARWDTAYVYMILVVHKVSGEVSCDL